MMFFSYANILFWPYVSYLALLPKHFLMKGSCFPRWISLLYNFFVFHLENCVPPQIVFLSIPFVVETVSFTLIFMLASPDAAFKELIFVCIFEAFVDKCTYLVIQSMVEEIGYCDKENIWREYAFKNSALKALTFCGIPC